VVGINLIEVASAMSVLTWPAVAPELEVYQRAVTSSDTGGGVCPFTGGTGSRAYNVQLSKPRTGYCARSGSG
jgi:hypothetical protein